jgi:hypothetical protein
MLYFNVKYIKSFKQLFELHYSDTYGNEFHDFVAKYKKLIRNKQINQADYFVQFTDHKDNNINKSIYQEPNHSDPVGNYGYPLDYVLKYPSDIWYGKNAKFFRILKSKTDNLLILNNIENESDCYYYAKKLGFTSHDIDEYIYLTKRYYKDRITGSTKWAKIFMQLLQVDFTQEPVDKEAGLFSHAKKSYPIRSGKEQTRLLIKAGYHAIEDRSRNQNSAIINNREPQQIIFLTTTSFTVEDVYRLTNDSRNRDRIMTTNNPPEQFERKVVSKVLSIFDGDKIKNVLDKQYNMHKHYFSNAGRRVGIYIEHYVGYSDGKKFGEKKHKELSTSDSFEMRFDIDTEYGTIIYRVNTDEKLNNLYTYLADRWSDMKENGDIVRDYPMTSIKFESDIEAERKAEYEKRQNAERQKEMKFVPGFIEKLQIYSERYNIPFKVYDTVEENYKLYKFADGCFNVIKRSNIDSFKDYINTINSEKMWRVYDLGESDEVADFMIDVFVAFAEEFYNSKADFPGFAFNNVRFE